MRIECPACAAVYDLPERLLSSGARVLRCAACGKTWSLNTNPSAAPETAAPAAPAPAPASSDREFAALMEAVVSAHKDDAPAEAAPAAAGDSAQEDESVQEGDAAKQDDAADDATASEPESRAESAPGIPPAAIVAHQPAPSPRPSFGLVMAWVATLGGLGALVLALALYPEGVVAHWPAAARLYEAVGITVGAS